jgi:hypothetical protein
MAILEDGKGRGYKAEVNAEQELVVRAITEEEIEHASATLGSAYSWDSTEKNVAAGATMLFVKNTGDVPLVLDRATINGSDVICFWTVLIGSATTTPAGGAVVTGVNLNQTFSAQAADAVARADETAVADGSIIDRVKTPIDNTIEVNLHGVILGRGHYVQINQITESDSGSVILFGHFELPS